MDFLKAELDKEFESIGFRSKRRSLKTRDHQIGKSVRSIDKKRKALRPGKRMSEDGGIYYEYRKNRSDRKNTSI